MSILLCTLWYEAKPWMQNDFAEMHTAKGASQRRMARAALQFGVRELAHAARVSTNTIARLERGERLYPQTLAKIRAACERAGVEFLADNGAGAGIRVASQSSRAVG